MGSTHYIKTLLVSLLSLTSEKSFCLEAKRKLLSLLYATSVVSFGGSFILEMAAAEGGEGHGGGGGMGRKKM